MRFSIAIFGATGKMGKSILEASLKDPTVQITAAVTHPQSRHLSNSHYTTDIAQAFSLCDVAIDFSVREATAAHVYAAQKAKKALVIGTTALLPEATSAIEKAAQDIPIVVSANFSLGITVCLEIAAALSRSLPGYRIDIHETHHIHKKDSPSGTALALACATGADVAIHSTRTNDVVGEHRLIFSSEKESIALTHTAHSREAFALGALLAAKKLIDKPAGIYTVKDLFLHA